MLRYLYTLILGQLLIYTTHPIELFLNKIYRLIMHLKHQHGDLKTA